MDLGPQLRGLHGFGTDNNVAALFGLALVFEFSAEGLSAGAHDLCEVNFYLANGIKGVVSVVVDHSKAELLVALEKVADLDGGFEVWVKLVLDHFCPAYVGPLAALLVVNGEDTARVRFREDIEVLQLAA